MTKKTFPSDKQDQYMIRFPDGMRDDLRRSAASMSRSMNAEIVQRLKSSLEDDEHEYYRISLPEETRNALSIDALVHDVDFEERASQVLQAAYDKSSDYTFSLLKVDKLAQEAAYLEAEVRRLEDTQNIDFLMYFTKVVQLSQFVESVIAAGDLLPSQITEQASILKKLTSAEIEILQNRKDRIERIQREDERLSRRYEDLDDESLESRSDDDDFNNKG